MSGNFQQVKMPQEPVTSLSLYRTITSVFNLETRIFAVFCGFWDNPRPVWSLFLVLRYSVIQARSWQHDQVREILAFVRVAVSAWFWCYLFCFSEV